MLEQEFEPRCASTSYTRSIFSKGRFSKLAPSHCLKAISKRVALFYRSPQSVSAAPKQWSQRMVSHMRNLAKLNPVKGQSPQEPSQQLGEGSVSNIAPHRHFSLQGKGAGPGQLTKRPLQLLRCRASIFPTATLASTSPSSLLHSMSWLPLPTGSGKKKADIRYSPENLAILRKHFKAIPKVLGRDTQGSALVMRKQGGSKAKALHHL